LLEKYLTKISKQPNYGFVVMDNDYFYLKVKEIKKQVYSSEVYSVEVEDTNNLLVNNGILVHNCIPVDPFYLSYIAKKYDFPTRFIELAGQINIRMPEFVVEKVGECLNKQKKTLNGAKILVLGLSYKKDIGDPRESPSFKIIELLEQHKAEVDYNDPYIPVAPRMRKFKIKKKSVVLTPKNLKKYDCVIIVTDHTDYDYDMILKNSNLIVDTRNVYKKINSKIIKA
jgi:UDP-N-acetyl-D-glucosamine dehydrogenase